MPPAAVTVAIALSGGVDSAVAALFLKRCVPLWRDVEALWMAKRALTYDEVCESIERCRPFSDVVAHASCKEKVSDSVEAIHYFPLFMRNWEDIPGNDEHGGSHWCERAEGDYNDATDVARAIGLLDSGEALSLHNHSATYVERCFEPMLSAYARGETLNVDVLCNTEVKFNSLLNALLATKKAQYLATGHYARTVYTPVCGCNNATPAAGRRVIARPFSSVRDLNDQTVFLSRLSPMQTLRAIFPLGHIFERKADVRAVAAHFGLSRVSKKKTSQGLCFVGEHYKRAVFGGSHNVKKCSGCTSSGFSSFLDEYMTPNNTEYQRLLAAGEKTIFIDASSGNVIDASELGLLNEFNETLLPAHKLTIGQMIRGKGNGKGLTRYYVQKKVLFPLQTCMDGRENCVRYLQNVWLVNRWDHILLFGKTAEIRDVVFSLHPLSFGEQECGTKYNETNVRLRCRCCARHQEPLRPATLCFARSDVSEFTGGARVTKVTVFFDEPVRALTPGQALVAYRPLATGSTEDAAKWFVFATGWIV